MSGNDAVSEIKSSIDIVNVISEYVPLKRAGSNYVGLCPFHREKTPSFSVSQAKQFYHCFGCGAGGDMFSFIMDIENVDFIDALNMLADKAGVDLSKYSTYDNKQNKEERNFKQRIYDVNQMAQKYYTSILYTPQGKPGAEYIVKRKLSKNAVEEFKIGYAVKGVYPYLKKLKFTDKEIEESGLIILNQDGSIYERFQDRLMFPIVDVRQRVIGFSGRILVKNDKVGKYINTNENIVYTKGDNLFGMHIAQKHCKDSLILVEGNMDVIALHQNGFKNVVAPLGTAFTERQANLIKDKTKQVLIAFDSDEAGIAATLKAIDILANKGIDIRIIDLKDTKDPDEFVQKYGNGGFKERIISAISGVDFKIKQVASNLDLDNINDRVIFLKELAKILADIENALEREVYINSSARQYNVTKEAIELEINNNLKTNKEQKIRKPYIINPEKRRDAKITNNSISNKRENLIIYLLLNAKEKKGEVKEVVENNKIIQNIQNEINLKTIKYLLDEIENEKIENISSLIENIQDKEIIEKITEVGMLEFNLDMKKSIKDILKAYEIESLKQRRTEVLSELGKIAAGSLENKDNTEEIKNKKQELENELNEIIKNIGALK